jgi:hypothetical protein
MSPSIDLCGKRFGRLVVVEKTAKRIHSYVVWKCLCDCGNESFVKTGDLNSGNTKSCGCLSAVVTGQRSRTHGMSLSGEYTSWSGMKYRCLNPDCKHYEYYGGRGITVDPRWLSFDNFYADMGPKPSRRHTLERVDTNGPYAPGNCIWATRKQQSHNLRSNVYVTYEGERMLMAEACRRSGIKMPTLCRRMKDGWPEDKWFLPPHRKNIDNASSGSA